MTGFLGFTLGGLVGGLLVGLLDAPTGGPFAVAIDSLVGALFGAGAGLLYPFIPPRLHALALLRALIARLRPGDALHDLCRTVTSLWILALGLPLLLIALEATEPLLLARVRSRLLGALAVALLGLAVTGLALALAAPLRAGLSRALETLVRRQPALSPLTRPDVHGVLALLAGLALLSRTPTALPGLPLAALALLAATTFIGGELALRLRWPRLLGLVVPGVAAAVLGVWMHRADLGAREQLRQTPALGTLLRARAPASTPSPDLAGP